MKPLPWLLALSLLAALACRSGGEPPAPASAPPRADFVWADLPVSSLDPAFANEAPQVQLVLDLFEGLLVHAPEGGVPRPGVARSYECSPDGRRYTFHLRPEARWSDGQPVTAEDFRFAIERVLAPETSSPLAQRLWIIEGAQALSEGVLGATLGVTAPDPHTLVLRLTAPAAHLPWLAASAVLLPVPRHVVEKEPEGWWRPPRLVSNGPFRLAEWRPGELAVLEPEPRYHGREAIRLARAELRVVRDPATAVRLFDAGELDWVPRNVPRDRILAARREGWRGMHREPSPCLSMLELRADRPPLEDRRLRWALSALVDREGLVEGAIQMDHRPAWGFVPDLYGSALGFRPREAARTGRGEGLVALATAGYPAGAGLPPLRLRHFDAGSHTYVVQAILGPWQAAGLKSLRAEASDWKSFVSDRAAGRFDLAYTNWCASYPDPLAHIQQFVSDAPDNTTGFADAAFDAAFRAALALPPGEARNEQTARALARLEAELPAIPLYFVHRHMLVAERVAGFVANPLGVHLLRDLGRR